MKRTPLKRKSALTAKARMHKVSGKRKEYRASDEGKAAMAYMGEVKKLPCAVCGAPGPSDAHHCFHNRYGSRKSSDYDVIPLCKRHHTDGPEAIHNGKETWRQKHGSDYDYIAATREAIARDNLLHST